LDQRIRAQQQKISNLKRDKKKVKSSSNPSEIKPKQISNLRKSRSLSLPPKVDTAPRNESVRRVIPLKTRRSRGSNLRVVEKTRPQTEEIVYQGYVLQHLDGEDVTRYYVLYEYGYLEGYESEQYFENKNNLSNTFSIELDTVNSVSLNLGKITITTSQGIVNTFSCPEGDYQQWQNFIKELIPTQNPD